MIFRKPIVYVNYAPLGYLITFCSSSLQLTKRYWSKNKGRELTISEIFSLRVGHHLRTEHFVQDQIELIANTPHEIEDAVREMNEQLVGIWKPDPKDEILQERFRALFRVGMNETEDHLHGEIHTRYSAHYLRNNQNWLT